MTRDEILNTLEEKGDDWVVAAMIEGSIGYHSVKGARILIEDIKNGCLRAMHRRLQRRSSGDGEI